MRTRRPPWIRVLPAVGVALLVPAVVLGFFLKKQFLVQDLVYTSKEGRFRVTFPAVPGNLEEETETDQTDFGPIEFHNVGRCSTGKFHGNGCGAGYGDLPAAILSKATADDVLDDCIDGLRDTFKDFKVLSKRAITSGPHAGCEVKARLTDNNIACVGTFRAFRVDRRVYWLGFHQPTEAKPEDPTPFFDSFEILKPRRAVRDNGSPRVTAGARS